VEYQILKRPPRRKRNVWIAVALVLMAAVAAGGYLVSRDVRTSRAAGPGPVAGAGTSTTTPVGARPMTVVSTVPATGAMGVPSDQVVSVTFSRPVAGTIGVPVFSPPVPGVWRHAGPDAITFVATAPFVPTTTETLTVPGGPAGVRGVDGTALGTPVTVVFGVAQASTERLQQLLAVLDYLPVSFTTSGPAPAPVEEATSQPGAFSWRWPGLPTDFTSLWTEGVENVITKGALMSFQSQHGLPVDGLAGRQVWTALLSDAAATRADSAPYTDVLVSKQVPQTLTLYENGNPVMANVAVNTGAPGADTADGTFPVFEHVPSSRMQGTNPDGTTYDDPAVPWASYFNGGDALHGFVRATYGSPQSNGCVEMPVAVAAQVWPLTPVGTPVTVIGPAS